MKTVQSLPLALLASLVTALPQPVANLESRQSGGLLGYQYDELKKGDCKDVTFIWVRGTTEIANMGEFVGGRMVPYLKKVFPSLAIQGVEYGAGITGNLLPGGGDQAGITDAVKMYNLALSKCPKTVITGGGYSQGAAITHRAVEKLPENVKERIAGITLYGDTQYYQDKGKIKNLAEDKVHTYCNGYAEWKSYSSDGVCNGLLMVNYGHMSYGDALKPGAEFLKQKVDAFNAKSAPAEESAEEKPKKKKAKSKSSTPKVAKPPQEEEAPVEEAPAPAAPAAKPKTTKTTKAKAKAAPKPAAGHDMSGMEGMRLADMAAIEQNGAHPREGAEIDVAEEFVAGDVPATLA